MAYYPRRYSTVPWLHNADLEEGEKCLWNDGSAFAWVVTLYEDAWPESAVLRTTAKGSQVTLAITEWGPVVGRRPIATPARRPTAYARYDTAED